ncbi:MAG: hypothetical protein HYY85_08290 [Deltaproteobacteria bacterium]|nr:hypothetical protein [Deltaproteobacteria bacterium]
MKFVERDVIGNPLSTQEIMDLLTTGPGQIRTPIVKVGKDVVLGYTVPKLEKIFG